MTALRQPHDPAPASAAGMAEPGRAAGGRTLLLAHALEGLDAVHLARRLKRRGDATAPAPAPAATDLTPGHDPTPEQAQALAQFEAHAGPFLLYGATGSGKTWLACALAHQAARSGFSVLYVRAARLFDELQVAHGDGSFARRLAQLARLDLLVIDDFAIAPMGAPERNDLLELLDDRVGTRATLITSQLPVTAWHAWLDEPTLADAILDRIVHGSHKIALKGESMRKLTKAV